MSSRTLFLSRLLGLYCIVMALSMFLRGQAMADTVTSMLGNAPLMLVLGIVVVIAGLAMVLTHNIWSGGTLTVLVTLAGWIALRFLNDAPAAAKDPEERATIFMVMVNNWSDGTPGPPIAH